MPLHFAGGGWRSVRSRHAPVTAWLERGLWIIGVVCAGLCVSVSLWGYTTRHSAHSAIAAAPSSHPTAGVSASSVTSDSGEIFGELTIPKLSLSVPILPDYDSASLLRGIGHVKGTAMPGGLGNMGLAGHRDTYFRPLRNITAGMEIHVRDASGTYRYIVDRTEVVLPDQVSVLDVGAQPELTLITCYPFSYVGAAPKRFIVHAHLLSVDADGAGTP